MPGATPERQLDDEMISAKDRKELCEADRALLHALRFGACPGAFFDSNEPSRRSLFLERAMKHYVAPLAYLTLKRAPVPAGWLRGLRAQYLRNSERNLRIFHELSKAVRALRDARIPVLLLKGGHLAQVVYGNIGARVLADVDLLFREEDFARAQRALFCGARRPFAERLPLDIHDRIEHSMMRRPIDEFGIWARSEAVEIGGVEVRALAPEDLLVHLCVHLAFHHRYQFGAMRTFCDIRETISHYGDRLDWEKVFTRAAEWGADKTLRLTLSLAHELLGVEFPAEASARIVKKALRGEVLQWAVEQIFQTRQAKEPLSPYFWKLLGHGSLLEKINLMARLLFTRPETISSKYRTPVRSVSNYLYYAVRIRENLGRYLRTMRLILKRDEGMAVFRVQQQRSVAMVEWLSQEE